MLTPVFELIQFFCYIQTAVEVGRRRIELCALSSTALHLTCKAWYLLVRLESSALTRLLIHPKLVPVVYWADAV